MASQQDTAISEADAKADVLRACQQLGLTLKEFAYANANAHGGRLLIDGDYIGFPRATPLRGIVPNAEYSPDIHLAIRVASGEAEKTFPVFTLSPVLRYQIHAFLEPYFEEWIVGLMTGEGDVL